MSTTEFNINKEKLEVEIKRTFNAPIERVWQAHVDPVLVAKWWGPSRFEMRVEKFDVKPGGEWRILHRESSGNEHWFHGEYKDVVQPNKIVRTFIYEPIPDQVMTETYMFEPTEDNMTKITVVSKFPSREALEGMVNSGMESGSREGIDRLAELVEAE